MPKVLLFTRKGLDIWVVRFKQYLLESGLCQSALILSEQNGIGDLSLNFLLNNFDSNDDIVLDNFSNAECVDIISRCRVLRGLSYVDSLRRINASIYLANYLIDSLSVEVYVSVRIDTYVNDVIERIFSRKGLIYLGLWRSAFFKDHFILTKRGELYTSDQLVNNDRNVSFINSLTSGNFSATSVNRVGSSFSYTDYLRKYLYLKIRDFYLNLFTFMPEYRNSYREFATRYYIRENRLSISSIPKKSFFKNACDIKFNSNSISVLIALQVNPESTIDYYVDDIRFLNVKNTLTELVKQFKGMNYEIYIKDHPNMNGRRNYNIFKDISFIDKNVTYINPNDNISPIIRNFTFVFTWSGTIAIEAFMNDSIPITVSPPYKITSRRFIHLENFHQLKSLSNLCAVAMKSHIVDDEKFILASVVNSSSFPGTVYPLNKKSDKVVDSFANIFRILNCLLHYEK